MDTRDTRAGPGALKGGQGLPAEPSLPPDQPPSKEWASFYTSASRGDLPTAPAQYSTDLTGAAYLRSATGGPEGRASLEIQRKAVLELADFFGVTVAQNYVLCDVASGLSPDRPGLQALWDLVESEAVQHIFARDWCRLWRDLLAFLRFVCHCDNHGVTLHFVWDHR